MRHGALAIAGLALLVSACGGEGKTPVRSASAKTPGTNPSAQADPLRQPMRYRPRNPQAQSLPGLEGVIGSSAADLQRQFGAPRLNVWEGDARKLQFSSSACVLDVYLYPASEGAEPRATYVDARRASDGQDVDRATCIAALKGR